MAITRTHPNRLTVQSVGQERPSRLTFEHREDMRKQIATLIKGHFVGTLLPEFWDGRDWKIDAGLLEELPTAGFDQRKAILTQTASLIATLAKWKGPFTSAHKDELLEAVLAALEASDVHLPWPLQEEPVYEEQLSSPLTEAAIHGEIDSPYGS